MHLPTERIEMMQRLYTALEAAIELNVDLSRVLQLCRAKRLGYTNPKLKGRWVITAGEIETYRALGPRKSGRPKQPKQKRLARYSRDGNHDYL